MQYRKYPDEETVNGYIKRKEPLIIAIPFDEEKPVLMSHYDDAFVIDSPFEKLDIEKYFRIVADGEDAKWLFVCPDNYKNIPDEQNRINDFYNDGMSVISRVLSDIGYFSDIRIPKRYRQYYNAMGDDSAYMP